MDIRPKDKSDAKTTVGDMGWGDTFRIVGGGATIWMMTNAEPHRAMVDCVCVRIETGAANEFAYSVKATPVDMEAVER